MDPSISTHTLQLERDWAQLGVLFGCEPSGRSPDLERLLLGTARGCPENARLLPLTVTWLASYGLLVARHRLKRLVLGLIIDEAVWHSAPRDLRIAADECQAWIPAEPLFAVQRGTPVLERIAERNASGLSTRWGVGALLVELKPDALRPVGWLLARNPAYRDRIVRNGDLCASILETLRRDLPGPVAPSESALTRHDARACMGARRSSIGAEACPVQLVAARPRSSRLAQPLK